MSHDIEKSMRSCQPRSLMNCCRCQFGVENFISRYRLCQSEKRPKDIVAAAKRSMKDAGERESFVKAARHITDFVSAYKPAARGLILFSDEADGFFWHQEVFSNYKSHPLGS